MVLNACVFHVEVIVTVPVGVKASFEQLRCHESVTNVS